METRDQRTTSEAQYAKHVDALSEDETAGEPGSSIDRENAAAEGSAEQELTL